MKKTLSLLLALALLCLGTIPALAENPTGGETVITANVGVSYQISIPESQEITFGVESTEIGDVAVTAAQIEEGYQITFTATCDGLMEKTGDATKTIAYALNSGGVAFTSASFTGVDSQALTVDITTEAWNAAAVGQYSDTITFTVNYELIP